MGLIQYTVKWLEECGVFQHRHARAAPDIPLAWAMRPTAQDGREKPGHDGVIS
jgi:hypothetical protein